MDWRAASPMLAALFRSSGLIRDVLMSMPGSVAASCVDNQACSSRTRYKIISSRAVTCTEAFFLV
jgi:hypothetical protein